MEPLRLLAHRFSRAVYAALWWLKLETHFIFRSVPIS